MSKKPHYRVGALNKLTDEKGTVGAAWLNDDSTISIVLNPFVKIEAKDMLITLFPNKE